MPLRSISTSISPHPTATSRATRSTRSARSTAAKSTWRPFLLGVAFKATGAAAAALDPAEGRLRERTTFLRSARFHGVPYRHPTKFPIASVAPTRAFYWLNAKDSQRAKDLARALYAAYFLEDLDISNADIAIAIAAKCGLGADEVRPGINDQAVKDATKTEVEKALAIGAFGSPYIVIDGEAFWGADRLDQIDRWLATGGF